MPDTYDSGIEADADRDLQRLLLAGLNASGRALRRDDCGAWYISGKHGSIHTWGDGKTWVLWVGCRSTRQWTATKKRLGFCEVTQDAEEEGCLRLHQLPTPEQAATVRDVLGIQKRREVSAAVRERLKAFAFERSTRSEPSLGVRIANSDRPATYPAPEETPKISAQSAPLPGE